MRYNDLLTAVTYQGRGMKNILLSLLVLDVYSQFNSSIVKYCVHFGMCMIGSFIVSFMELIATFRPAHWWSYQAKMSIYREGLLVAPWLLLNGVTPTLLMLTRNIFVTGSVSNCSLSDLLCYCSAAVTSDHGRPRFSVLFSTICIWIFSLTRQEYY